MRFVSIACGILLTGFVGGTIIAGSETRNATALKARYSKEIIYIATCVRRGWWHMPYEASYGLWYSDWENSQDNQFPEGWTEEYRDTNGGPVTFPGQEQRFAFVGSGDTIDINIADYGVKVAKNAYAGYLELRRLGSGSTTRWGCARDNDRELFYGWQLPGAEKSDHPELECRDSLFYCYPGSTS